MVKRIKKKKENRQVRRLAGPRNHHNWGSNLSPEERDADKEPRDINDLEKLALRAHNRMLLNNSKIDFETVVRMLRQEHNLSFKMLCKKCYGTHGYDELDAPER